MTVLVIGGTGTLGRQIVLYALQRGYSVRCLIRDVRKATFLKLWGAELCYGDLALPETLPKAFKDVSVVIDASTLRVDDETGKLYQIDFLHKIALLKAAEVAEVERYVFFTFASNSSANVPALKLKLKFESLLQKSRLNFTIFKLPAFFQGLISQYAIPILEQQSIWLSNESFPTSYINTQDIAKFCIRSLVIPDTKNKIFSLTSENRWFSEEIVTLCETLAGQKAQIQRLPGFVIQFLRLLTSSSKWLWPISDRLAFFLVTQSENQTTLLEQDLLGLFFFKEGDLLPLDTYLQEYFETMLNRLRYFNFDQKQALKRKDLPF